MANPGKTIPKLAALLFARITKYTACTEEEFKKISDALSLASTIYKERGERIHKELLTRTCSVPSCYGKHIGNGFCRVHYDLVRKTGTTERKPPKPVKGPYVKKPKRPIRICSVEGCERKHKRNGYCNTHFSRWRRNGSPGEAQILPPGKHTNRGIRQSQRSESK